MMLGCHMSAHARKAPLKSTPVHDADQSLFDFEEVGGGVPPSSPTAPVPPVKIADPALAVPAQVRLPDLVPASPAVVGVMSVENGTVALPPEGGAGPLKPSPPRRDRKKGPARARFTFEGPARLKRKLERAAIAEDRSMTAIHRAALEKYLRELGDEE